MSKKNGLTERQDRFVVNYATIPNSKKAALRAGYSEKTAAVMGCRLLKKKEVRAALSKIRGKDNRKMELTREGVLDELAKSLFRDPLGLEDDQGFTVSSLKDVPVELRTIIDSFKVTQQLGENGTPISQRIEVKLIPKASAIDMGMKHMGAYAAEKQEQRVSVDWDKLYGKTVIIDPVDEAIKQIGND